MIRLFATASIVACALVAVMAPAAAATEDPAGTARPAAEDAPPVEADEEPAAHPTPQHEPPPKKPPRDDEDPDSDETIEPAPTDSVSTEPPPGDTTGNDGDGEPGPPTGGGEDAALDDAVPPTDSPPGEIPAAEPPRVVVEAVVPETPAIAVVESDTAAPEPGARAPSAAKPADRPRSNGPAPSASTARSQAADQPAADADPSMDGLARARRPDSSPDTRFDHVATAGAGFMAGLAATGRAHATIAVAVEFGRAGGGWAGALVFNMWLRRQLRERRMSQRQLAALSGIDHSTISRLLSEDRRPSLATATKLVAAFGQVRGDEAEPAAADYFQRMPEETVFPARRVELALRADEALDEEQIRQLMSMYLNARRRHLAVQKPPATMGRLRPIGPPEPASVRRR